MSIEKNKIHLLQVELWEKANARGLPSENQAQLFVNAIHAIEKRTLLTLSSVTLMVILDRVLHQSKEKHPVLSGAKLDSTGISFVDLLQKAKAQKSKNIVDALRYFLVELLSILGSITADVLTSPLHKELLKVKWPKFPEET